jgi:hypothetical protein
MGSQIRRSAACPGVMRWELAEGVAVCRHEMTKFWKSVTLHYLGPLSHAGNSVQQRQAHVLRDCVQRSLRDTIEHQANRRDVEHRFRSLNMTLVVFRQTPIKTKPCETSLGNPCQPSDFEGTLLALEDL